jgi:hypothetical protein
VCPERGEDVLSRPLPQLGGAGPCCRRGNAPCRRGNCGVVPPPTRVLARASREPQVVRRSLFVVAARPSRG